MRSEYLLFCGVGMSSDGPGGGLLANENKKKKMKGKETNKNLFYSKYSKVVMQRYSDDFGVFLGFCVFMVVFPVSLSSFGCRLKKENRVAMWLLSV